MESVRLDPSDPLGSVLRWLAALALALGIEPARLAPAGPLPRAAAALVRAWLADWSRQLSAVVRLEAARLAKTLRLPMPVRRRAVAAGSLRPAARTGAPAGRSVVVGSSRRGLRARRGTACSATWSAADAVLGPAEEAALRRRANAVLAALADPRALTARLAARLALRLARASASSVRPDPRRVPVPPRVLGVGLRACDRAPEPRPPDLRAPVPA
jgi:hypothetical protein